MTHKQDVSMTGGHLGCRSSPSSAHLFYDGQRTHHAECNSAEKDALRVFAEENDKELCLAPGKGQCMPHSFLKVAHMESDVYEKRFGDLRFDVKWAAETALQLNEDKDPAVCKSPAVQKNPRGATHFDGGLGSLTNDMDDPNREGVMSFPQLTRYNQKEVCKSLHRAAAHALDCAMDFMDEHAVDPDGTKPHEGKGRHQHGGKKAREACGANHT